MTVPANPAGDSPASGVVTVVCALLGFFAPTILCRSWVPLLRALVVLVALSAVIVVVIVVLTTLLYI